MLDALQITRHGYVGYAHPEISPPAHKRKFKIPTYVCRSTLHRGIYVGQDISAWVCRLTYAGSHQDRILAPSRSGYLGFTVPQFVPRHHLYQAPVRIISAWPIPPRGSQEPRLRIKCSMIIDPSLSKFRASLIMFQILNFSQICLSLHSALQIGHWLELPTCLFARTPRHGIKPCKIHQQKSWSLQVHSTSIVSSIHDFLLILQYPSHEDCAFQIGSWAW